MVPKKAKLIIADIADEKIEDVITNEIDLVMHFIGLIRAMSSKEPERQ